jgi:maleylacetate reductase
MLDPFVYKSDRLRVVFGCGTVAKLAEEAERLKMMRVLVLCSQGRGALGESIGARLGASHAGVCNAARPGMPSAAFDQIVAELERTRADGFVCVGGGSPIGLAKAVAAATKLPFIAIVTTYSGSEMAPRWYLGTGADERSGDSSAALPSSAIYDPELTVDLPFATTAASCMNAMAHAVESLYGPDANPIVLALAEEAVRRLAAALPRLDADPKNVAARTDALYGAWLAAAFRASIGLSHNIAQRIRQNFGTEHARTHAVALPYAAAFSLTAAPAARERLVRALGAGDPAQALHGINVACGLPSGLKDLGLRETDIPRAVDIVAKRKFPCPRPCTPADIEAVIRQAFAGQPPRF